MGLLIGLGLHMKMLLTALTLFATLLGTGPSAHAFPVAALQEDLAVLRAAIIEGHPGAERYLDARAFAARLDAAGQITAPMDATEFYRVLVPVIAALEDGHTSLDLSESDSDAFRARAPVLPLRVYVHGGRLFILRDLSGGSRSLAGREIVSINDVDARQIVSQLIAATPGDGRIVTGREYRLSSGLRFNRLYALLNGSSAVYRVRVRGRLSSHTYDLRGVSLATLEAVWEQQFPQDRAAQVPVELSYAENGRVAVLTIRSFAGFADLERQQRLSAFLANAFAELKARNVRALVIDVRGNGGGADELGRLLFSYLAERPFEYYRGLYLQSREYSFAEHASPPVPGPPPELYDVDADNRLRWREHANYGVHEPAGDSFSGPVFVLMDGGSFSTTAEFLSVAHFNRRVVFVGEEAGGAYYGNTSGLILTVTLPNTGLRLRLPIQRYELAVEGFSPTDRGVPADYAVAPSIADLVAGRDPVMQMALDLARRQRGAQ